jgi:DNA-binding beta-propeller fold protein YncE
MKYNVFILLMLSALLTTGCKKDPQPDPEPTDSTPKSAYLLSEGSWGGNDAEISLINLDNGNITLDWFSSNNRRGIGDLAQDLIHYGNKLYATVFTSNTIEVINPVSGKSIKQIDMGNRGPRYIAPHNGKIYVSCYDKTIVRIDTATFAIEATCQLSGMQPEQLCVIGDNLYVCNCWQYDANGEAIYDSTVSVVNLPSFTETHKINVGHNPGKIKALDSHRFIVACAGDHLSPVTLIVDILSQEMTPLSVAATNFDIHNNTIYLYNTSYDAQWNPTASFYRVDATTLQATPILENYSHTLPYAYSINIDPATGNLYICNSPYNANADLYTFRPDGTLLHKVEGGILSSKVVF